MLSGHAVTGHPPKPSNHSLDDSLFGESQAYHKTQVSEGRGVREEQANRWLIWRVMSDENGV